MLEQERKEVLKDITAAIVDGETEKADALVEKYQVVPTDAAIKAESVKRELSRDERDAMR